MDFVFYINIARFFRFENSFQFPFRIEVILFTEKYSIDTQMFRKWDSFPFMEK